MRGYIANLRCSTSLLAPELVPRTGFIESAILLALTSAGFSGAALGVLTPLLTYGALAGAQFLLSALTMKKPPTPKGQDVQANIRSPLSPRRRHHGRTLVGSVIVFGFRRGQFIYILHYIGEGPIEGYAGFRLDKRPVTLDGDGFVTDEQFQNDEESKVQLLTTLGTMADEPFDEIIAAFPELDRPLKPFRHRGCAMVLQIIEEVPLDVISDVFPNNMPSLEVLVDGLKHYDPRTEATGLSDNAGVCLLNEIMDVYGLTTADTDWINFESFATHADYSDDPIALKAGGTERRWRCAGTIEMDAENEDRVKAIAGICNADVHFDREGKIAVRKKVSATPSITLSAADGDHLSISLEGGRRLQKKFNAVKVVYRESLLNWKENEAYYRNADAIEADGQEFVQPVGAQLCPSGPQGQRIGKLIFHDENPEFIGQAMSGPQAMELMEDPVCTIDLSPEDDLVFVAKTGGLELDAQAMTCSFSLQSIAADAEDWDAATEEQDVVEVGPLLVSYVDDVPLDVTFAVTVLADSSIAIDLSWVPAAPPPGEDPYEYGSALTQDVELSLAGEDEWLAANVAQETDTARFAPVANNVSYDGRIRNRRAGKTFDWQDFGPIAVAIAAAPTGPPDPATGVSAIGGANLTVYWTASVAPYAGARVYFGTRASFTAAQQTNPISIGTAGAADSKVISLPPGTYYAWVEAFGPTDIVANRAAAVSAGGPVTVT